MDSEADAQAVHDRRVQLQYELFHQHWLPAYLGSEYPRYAHLQPGYLETLFPKIRQWGPEYDKAKRALRIIRHGMRDRFDIIQWEALNHLHDSLKQGWVQYYAAESSGDLINTDNEAWALAFQNLETRGVHKNLEHFDRHFPGQRKLLDVLYHSVHWQLRDGSSPNYNSLAHDAAFTAIQLDVFQQQPAFEAAVTVFKKLVRFTGEAE